MGQSLNIRPGLFGLILCLFQPVFAAEASLAVLLELALVQHPVVLQAREKLEAAGYDVEGAKWGRFPTLSSETRAPRNSSQSITKLEQPLWSGGRISAQIDISEANERVARDLVAEAQLNVLQQLTSAYFELLRMQARLRVADENVSEHARLEDLMGRRVAAEVSPAADLVLANVRLQQAITERIQLLRIRDTAKVALQQWSLSEVSTALPLRRIDMLPLGGGKQIDGEKIVSKVLAYSVQRRRLQHQLDAARAQRQLASAQGLPTVLAGYQYVWGGPAPSTADRGTAYLALQYQPGAGLAALSSLKAAARREDAVRQELAGIERELRAQVQTVLAEMDASNAQLVPSRNLLKGSSDIVESYLRQYQVGRRNWIEVLNAQRERAQAAYALADAEQGLQLAQVRLLIISGVVAPGELKAISG